MIKAVLLFLHHISLLKEERKVLILLCGLKTNNHYIYSYIFCHYWLYVLKISNCGRRI